MPISYPVELERASVNLGFFDNVIVRVRVLDRKEFPVRPRIPVFETGEKGFLARERAIPCSGFPRRGVIPAVSELLFHARIVPDSRMKAKGKSELR